MAQHAYMIGTGIGNLAAGIYLIRDGGWDGSQITMLGLEKHGANDGQATKGLRKRVRARAVAQ